MTKARDIMTTDVITLAPETDIIEAAKVLLDNGINGAPVVDEEGKLQGLLCQSDLVVQQKKLPLPSVFTLLDMIIPLSSTRQLEKEVSKIAALTASEAMTKHPVTVDPDTDLETIAALMVDNNFHTLPVLENDRLVGVIGKEDVLKTLFAAPGKSGSE
ncbi:MAG: CBS domain-containing protein [Desulfosalsimonadaceae bacterium]